MAKHTPIRILFVFLCNQQKPIKQTNIKKQGWNFSACKILTLKWYQGIQTELLQHSITFYRVKLRCDLEIAKQAWLSADFQLQANDPNNNFWNGFSLTTYSTF